MSVLSSPGADDGVSRSSCGRSPRTDVGAVPAQTLGRPLGRGSSGESGCRCGHTASTGRKSPCTCVCVCASACAPASVWLPFYAYIELATLLPLCECAHVHGGPCVSGSAYVRWRARAWATARACNSGDGRGAGRSRTAWEHGYVCWATPLQSDMSASAGSKLMLAGLLD